MNRSEYLTLMNFPKEWEEFGMVPDDWLTGAITTYEVGNEQASEHDRNSAFHWWLKKRNPTPEQLILLVRLSYLDPDQLMAADVREYIRKASNYCAEVKTELIDPSLMDDKPQQGP